MERCRNTQVSERLSSDRCYGHGEPANESGR
jgi:hypothetical protein